MALVQKLVINIGFRVTVLVSTDQPVVEYVVLTATGKVTVLDQVTVSSIKGSMAGCW